MERVSKRRSSDILTLDEDGNKPHTKERGKGERKRTGQTAIAVNGDKAVAKNCTHSKLGTKDGEWSGVFMMMDHPSGVDGDNGGTIRV